HSAVATSPARLAALRGVKVATLAALAPRDSLAFLSLHVSPLRSCQRKRKQPLATAPLHSISLPETSETRKSKTGARAFSFCFGSGHKLEMIRTSASRKTDRTRALTADQPGPWHKAGLRSPRHP